MKPSKTSNEFVFKTHSVHRNDSRSFLLIDLLPFVLFTSTLTGSIDDELEISVELLPKSTSNQFNVHSISSSPPRQST